jgi:hypothetical protein
MSGSNQEKVKNLLDSQLFRDSAGHRMLTLDEKLIQAATNFLTSVEELDEKMKALNNDRNFLHTTADEFFTKGREGIHGLMKSLLLDPQNSQKVYDILNKHEVDLMSGNYSVNIQKLNDYFISDLKKVLLEVFSNKQTEIDLTSKSFEDAFDCYNSVKRIKTLQERARELMVNVEAYLSGLPLERNHAYFSGKVSGQEKMNSLVEYINDRENYTLNLSPVDFSKHSTFSQVHLHDKLSEILGVAKKVKESFNAQELEELHTAYNRVAETFQLLTSTTN